MAARAAAAVLFLGELTLLSAVAGGAQPSHALEIAGHAANIAALLSLTAVEHWRYVAIGAVLPAWMAVLPWQADVGRTHEWMHLIVLAGSLYVLFVWYPLALGKRARDTRDPYIAAILASGMFFFAAKSAFADAGLSGVVGAIPVLEAVVLGTLIKQLLGLQPAGGRDVGRLALTAGAALAFATVAIPLQLDHQWITVGWALEGCALAWLYTRVPHRGLLYTAVALLTVVFVRLTINPEVLLYEARSTTRVLNWYLYTYLIAAVAAFAAARWLRNTSDQLVAGLPRASQLLPAAGVVLLFLLLNIEIADFYSTGSTITFRFGATLSQDLTYTIGWLAFGMLLLAAGIVSGSRPARTAAVGLIAVTTFKCFLYDLGSLEGLYRVASFVGLALSLALVAIALQKYVLRVKH